jgi:hypothetical protein
MFMANEPAIASVVGIESLILTVRGQRVMLDSDLAKVYGVSTKHLNQQYRRNCDRFPKDFAFRVTPQEFTRMRSQFVTASRRNIRHCPLVFTEHGAIMLGMVLKSPVAAEASIRVVRAFVLMREQLSQASQISVASFTRKLAVLEGRVGQHDEAIKIIFTAIRELLEPPAPVAEPPKRRIGFGAENRHNGSLVLAPART